MPRAYWTQVRERIRYKHYSLRTEQAYVQWVKVFVKWSGLRHPRDMGGPEIEAFLTMLATERRVAASTHNQALSALLFLCREVLTVDLPWLDNIQRPSTPKRIPSVLTTAEVISQRSSNTHPSESPSRRETHSGRIHVLELGLHQPSYPSVSTQTRPYCH